MNSLKLFFSILFFISGCQHRNEKVEMRMMSFDIKGENEFEMCFDKFISAGYHLTIKTKSGKELKIDGFLEKPFYNQNKFCFEGKKHIFSLKSFQKKRFLYDSIVNSNINSVEWWIYNNPKKVIAKGELSFN